MAWAFSDQGANLTAQYLTAHGYRANIDFAYHYGLLPLLLGRIWFSLSGATPHACVLLVFLCTLAAAWALARIALNLELGITGVAFLVIALPLAIPFNPPNLAHALEAALLSNALAEQAAQRHSRSLALATAGLFVRPSMSYVYGFLLLLLLLWRLNQERHLNLRRMSKALLPALLTGTVLVAILGFVYGFPSLVRAVFPLTGLSTYSAQNFGFCRAGRGFWYPTSPHFSYYADTPAGFWIAGTLWLLICGAIDARRALIGGSAKYEIVLCCAVLHLAFISLFFGNRFSWWYYSYMLCIGIAVSSTWTSIYRDGVCALALIALVGQASELVVFNALWRVTSPSPATAGLWASKSERFEWERVIEIVREGRSKSPATVSLLEEVGCVELLFSGFQPPVSLYLIRGEATKSDIARKLAQMSHSSTVVVLIRTLHDGLLPDLPQFKQVLAKYHVVWKGENLEVYEKR